MKNQCNPDEMQTQPRYLNANNLKLICHDPKTANTWVYTEEKC